MMSLIFLTFDVGFAISHLPLLESLEFEDENYENTYKLAKRLFKNASNCKK